MTTTSKIQIPDRLYFRIGDVAELIGVKPYVLRYWESEFPMINPQKSSSGQRVYRRSDVETVLMIKHLLYEERYSVEGAKKRIKELRKEGELKEYKEETVAAAVATEAEEEVVIELEIPPLPVQVAEPQPLPSQSAQAVQAVQAVHATQSSQAAQVAQSLSAANLAKAQAVVTGVQGTGAVVATSFDTESEDQDEILKISRELRDLLRKPISELWSY